MQANTLFFLQFLYFVVLIGCFRNPLTCKRSQWRLSSRLPSLFDNRPDYQSPSIQPETLSILDRIGRSLSFYSAAIPIFASYKGLDLLINFRNTFKNNSISENQQDSMFDELHEWGSEVLIKKVHELKGFYVKTGQIISTRVDIFPKQYTEKLAITQDQLDPIPSYIVRDVVRRELLKGGELDELFLKFDDEPLGSASIAQVHRAQLLDGRYVAVKVQRPGIAAKAFAKVVSQSLLIDYYRIFAEIELTLQDELDFLQEAQATSKVAAAVAHTPSNRPHRPPVKVPLPIPGLVTKNVLVLEYVNGTALSQIAKRSKLEPGSPEAKLFGGRLLKALTDAYGLMIFGSGIIHGGNIFVLEDGEVALLDCGQVKQISTSQRLGLATTVDLVYRYESLSRKNQSDSQVKEQIETIIMQLDTLIRSFGVTFRPDASPSCAAAVAVLLFGSSDAILPGGYAGLELSLDSPLVQVQEFPSELVLLGRATVMLRGIAKRLQITWGLAEHWVPLAREALGTVSKPTMLLPVWSVSPPTIHSPFSSLSSSTGKTGMKDVWMAFAHAIFVLGEYLRKKIAHIVLKGLPTKWREWIIKRIAAMQEKKASSHKL
eukprot:scaffold1450_cov181-Ochromonas_danica.AAC.2